MDNSDILKNLALKVWSKCKERNITLCAAESCTGGLIADSLVSFSGASSFFLGSAVCYCNDAKENVLRVSAQILDKYSAESSECCQAMLDGAVTLYKGDSAIATTGFLDANASSESLKGVVFVGISIKEIFTDASIFQTQLCGVGKSDILCGKNTGTGVSVLSLETKNDRVVLLAKLTLNPSMDRIFNMRATVATAFDLFSALLK